MFHGNGDSRGINALQGERELNRLQVLSGESVTREHLCQVEGDLPVSGIPGAAMVPLSRNPQAYHDKLRLCWRDPQGARLDETVAVALLGCRKFN